MKKRYAGPLIVIVLITVGLFLWFKEGQLPVDPADKTSRTFAIEQGQALNTIINDLQKEDLIRNRIVFYILVKKLGIEHSIQAGEYQLNKSMNAAEVARNLTHGTYDKWVTVVEGLRKEEIAQLFVQSHGVVASAFIKDATEGMLFPDTYLIPTGSSATEIVSIMYKNFQYKAAPVLEQIGKKKLTQTEILTLASLIEREAKYYNDRRIVAGILLNSLDTQMPLQVDATVQYALGFDETANTWWKKDLSVTDLRIDSPYNTYTNQGLPPRPICNPGLSSINAVIAPKESDYWYYLHDPSGGVHYGKTIEEHNTNISKYL